MYNKSPPPWSQLSYLIAEKGIYEHYKGARYLVLHIARHSETQEELVVYQALYGKQELWVRPLAMFVEHVEVNSRLVPRFKLLGP